LQLVKKFPAFYWTRRFINALTSARHLFLSWAIPIQSTHPHPTSRRGHLVLQVVNCALYTFAVCRGQIYLFRYVSWYCPSRNA
jgi:hypothetical protein